MSYQRKDRKSQSRDRRSPVLSLMLSLALVAIAVPQVAPGEENKSDRQSQQIRKIILSRGNNPAALAHLVQLTKDLEAPAAAQLFRQLADDYLQQGSYDLAGSVLGQLVLQYSDQPAAVDGLIMAAQLYSSLEVAHSQQASVSSNGNQSTAAYGFYLVEQAVLKQRELAENPALAFQCAVSARLDGNAQVAQSWLTPLKYNSDLQPWHQRALAEKWLLEERRKSPPLQTLACPTAGERPHLDGVLDEALWQSAEIAILTPPEKSPLTLGSTRVQFSHDAKFLYLAIRCQKLPGKVYLASNQPRAHDADLTKQDHLQIKLDLDRDYATAFTLSVDHRGQTADACWKDSSWNPRWFVASKQDESQWTIEAAIAWEELTSSAPQARDAWAISIKRVLPDAKPHLWTGGAEPVADEFGLVIFE